MKKDFITAVQERRTIYGLGRQVNVPDEKILELVEHAVMHCPTAFNSQSGRVVVLFGSHHDKLWDITKGVLRKIVPADKFALLKKKSIPSQHTVPSCILRIKALLRAFRISFPFIRIAFQYGRSKHQECFNI